jgi:hypothetical protein
MPDTKKGRERTGRNKRAQLERELARQEVETLDEPDELPQYPREPDLEFGDDVRAGG